MKFISIMHNLVALLLGDVNQLPLVASLSSQRLGAYGFSMLVGPTGWR